MDDAIPAGKNPREKNPREVQIWLRCKDVEGGVVRSVTPRSLEDVPEVKRCLWELRDAAPELAYIEVKSRLRVLRERFVSRTRAQPLLSNSLVSFEKRELRAPAAAREAFAALKKPGKRRRIAGDCVLVDFHVVTPTSSPLKFERLNDSMEPVVKKERRSRSQMNYDMKAAKRGLFAELDASDELAAVVGRRRISRTDALRAVWDYIKDNQIQRGRIILPDDKLAAVCCKEPFDCFRLNGKLLKHLVIHVD